MLSLLIYATTLVPVFPSLLTRGDAAYRNRADERKAYEALELYRESVAVDPKSVEALWRLSMACHFIGMRIVKTEEEKVPLFEEGKAAGKKAIAEDPECAPCHFWTAINQALYGEAKGVFKMLFSLKEIEKHLYQTLEIDPQYAVGGAYRVLGAIQEKLPGILGGSNEAAKRFYESAIAAVPEEPLNYLFLARLLNTEFSDSASAKKVAATGLSFPLPPQDHIESLEARQELKELLSAIGT